MNLTDEQWCILDLLMRAREKGVLAINQHELLNSEALTLLVRTRLAWAALVMPNGLVAWHRNDLSITEAGIRVYETKFGVKPTKLADSVIYLPGPEHPLQ